MHDVVIRGGNVVDGSGAPAVTADIAIDGDRISAVGRVGAGKREISADGLLVTPGWVDVHTHYDGQITWDPYLTPSSWHGVTSVVMGNCGVGFAPVLPEKRDWLIGLMEGVEDIPGAALSEGIKWEWETFPEYMKAIESSPHAIDFGVQVPHGAVRAYVMGDRGASNETATPADIKAMAALVEEGLHAGALGFSTSRTLMHKSIDGVPVPGTFAGRDELFGIGDALRRSNKGVFQIAAQHEEVPSELDWLDELAQFTGRPMSFNLSQIDTDPQLWRRGLERLERADSRVVAQVAGRGIGIILCWEGTGHPFLNRAAYLPYHDLSPEARLEQLRKPEVRAAIINDAPMNLDDLGNFVTRSWQKMFVRSAGEVMSYEPPPESSVAAIAQATGRKPEEVAYDALMELDGRGSLYFPLFNYGSGSLDEQRELLLHPRTRLGLSDGGAHCGAICDGGMATFMLTHWARDRSRGERIDLEKIVRMQTYETAQLFGLGDRGLLKVGMKADVNLIDYAALALENPRMVYDLPTGGRRLVQRARGYVATMCSGEVIMSDGEPTGSLPGQLLRGAR
ncbi:MAG: amidohydrolase family protein [Myxococcota bacterium]|nr:amidohydrolase family protein [Myxococcota bacterium]